MFFSIIDILKNLFCFTGSYSNDVFPEPLDPIEEEKCIKGKMNGNMDDRNKLIEHNLRLVAHIVKKYESKGNTDDLISIGTIGLIKGIDSYRPQKKVKLTTYAAKCADNEILMYFRSNKKYNNNISLNDVIGHDKDGGDITLIDVLKEETESPIKTIEYNDNIAHLSKYLTVLNKRELEIIKMRYGLLNTSEKTQKEIAKKLGISRSYVSRIEKRALIKMLREFIKNNN